MHHRNPDLEAELVRSPDDVALYQVYADWLGSQGDPRGELIALGLAPHSDEVAQRLTTLHALHDEAWLGGTFGSAISIGWKRGFVDTIKIGDDDAAEIDLAAGYAQVAQIRERPIGLVWRELVFGAFMDDDDYMPRWDAAAAALATHGVPPSLRSLRFDRGDYWDISSTHLGGLDVAYPLLGALESLYIEVGNMELGTIVLPALREFEVYTGGFTQENMRSVVDATWPALERLILRFGDSEDYGATCTLADVLPLFDRDLPNVRHLALANSGFTDALIPELATTKLLAQLETLDLGWGLLADAGAAALLKHRDAFAHLRKIDLKGSYLTAEAIAQLEDTFPDRLDTSDQKAPERYRYCQISE